MKELLFLVVHNGQLYIKVVMAVLLYGMLMCCRVRLSVTERIDKVARWWGVGVSMSTGCACIVFARPNSNTSSHPYSHIITTCYCYYTIVVAVGG